MRTFEEIRSLLRLTYSDALLQAAVCSLTIILFHFLVFFPTLHHIHHFIFRITGNRIRAKTTSVVITGPYSIAVLSHTETHMWELRHFDCQNKGLVILIIVYRTWKRDANGIFAHSYCSKVCGHHCLTPLFMMHRIFSISDRSRLYPGHSVSTKLYCCNTRRVWHELRPKGLGCVFAEIWCMASSLKAILLAS